MAKLRYSLPGIGGSLGSCILCGDTFTFEILTGKSVPLIGIDGIQGNLPIHDKCKKVLLENGSDFHTLPDGPLKQAFSDLENERNSEVSQ